jgi:Fur family ferric uptake transcriptional regulator
LVCLDCGRVEEFYDEQIEKQQHAIALDRGFKIAEHALAIYGNCTKEKCEHKDKESKEN